jgi:hypothetical protein
LREQLEKLVRVLYAREFDDLDDASDISGHGSKG